MDTSMIPYGYLSMIHNMNVAGGISISYANFGLKSKLNMFRAFSALGLGFQWDSVSV